MRKFLKKGKQDKFQLDCQSVETHVASARKGKP